MRVCHLWCCYYYYYYYYANNSYPWSRNVLKIGGKSWGNGFTAGPKFTCYGCMTTTKCRFELDVLHFTIQSTACWQSASRLAVNYYELKCFSRLVVGWACELGSDCRHDSESSEIYGNCGLKCCVWSAHLWLWTRGCDGPMGEAWLIGTPWSRVNLRCVVLVVVYKRSLKRNSVLRFSVIQTAASRRGCFWIH